jgi:DNA-binding GntR family transcriptional regulator
MIGAVLNLLTVGNRFVGTDAEAGSRHSALVSALEEDILFGRVLPRQRLVEDDLIDRFQATRHMVRQALLELERRGMVTRLANKGALVRDFSQEDVEQICVVREMLHAKAAELIPLPVDPELLRRLTEIHEAHSREVQRNNLREVHRLNIEFHRALFAASGNKYLLKTIEEYSDMSLVFRSQLMSNPAMVRQARDQHGAMVKALRQGDRKKLVRLCTEHTRPSRDVYFALRGWSKNGTDNRLNPFLPKRAS